MTYLDEAYRRMKLPISVRVLDGALENTHGKPMAVFVNGKFYAGGYHVQYVADSYQEAVNELGGM